MKFGPVPVEAAAGGILAHSLRVGDGVLKKGRVLDEDDLEALGAAGHTEVVVARIEDGDVPEDEAAGLLGAAAGGAGVRVGPAYTGRANLYAEVRGVLVLERERVDAINEVHPGLTVATAPPHALVDKGEMVGTVKVIPFAVPLAAVRRCETLCRVGAGLLSVAPLRPRRVGIVLTRLPGTREPTLDKAAAVLRARVERLGSVPGRLLRCAHDEAEVAAAIETARAEGCSPVVVFGASAVVDRGDVIPAAILRAGGEVIHFGMPVDPGNLLLLGAIDDTVVIGAPGCARSPRPSGFDDVLQRVLAGIPVTARDLQRMGAGGLLKEIPSRPSPRAGADRGEGRRVVDAIVLAAGQSRRMGDQNKLLAPVDGHAMVDHVVANLQGARVRDIVVVTGHEADAVRTAIDPTRCRFVDNPQHAEGMSTSLRAGLDALRPGADGALIALGDMPLVRPAHIDALLEAFDPVEGRAIVVPTHRGKRGNPVLWAARYFPEMRALSGDAGARSLFLVHAEAVCEVPLDDEAVLVDVDTPEALARLGDPTRPDPT